MLMNNMFNFTLFNQPLKSWDVSKVKNMKMITKITMVTMKIQKKDKFLKPKNIKMVIMKMEIKYNENKVRSKNQDKMKIK